MSERYPNKRLMFRGGGRYRRGTLADIGMIGCPHCGAIVPIKFDEVNGFVDPASRRADCNCQSIPQGGKDIEKAMTVNEQYLNDAEDCHFDPATPTDEQ